MKTLYLLRHAKADASSATGRDRDRALSEEGRNAAMGMGAYFRANGHACDAVLCSAAQRTRETLALMLPEAAQVFVEEGLYMAEDAEMLTRIGMLDNAFGSALLVAHNPGIGELAALLAAEAHDSKTRELHGRLYEGYPTGALTVLRFRGKSWNSVKAGRGELLDFMRPRDL